MKIKTKQYIMYIVVAGILIGIGWLVGASNNDDAETKISEFSESKLAVTEMTYDFGTISMKDGNVVHNYEIKNEGVESVIIDKVYTSCMCTTAYITDKGGKRHGKFGMPGHGVLTNTNITVPSGESVTLEAIFDPAAHGPSGVGLARRNIYIETNSKQSPKLEVAFQAMVTQ
jgi:hypothetical protein